MVSSAPTCILPCHSDKCHPTFANEEESLPSDPSISSNQAAPWPLDVIVRRHLRGLEEVGGREVEVVSAGCH